MRGVIIDIRTKVYTTSIKGLNIKGGTRGDASRKAGEPHTVRANYG